MAPRFITSEIWLMCAGVYFRLNQRQQHQLVIDLLDTSHGAEI